EQARRAGQTGIRLAHLADPLALSSSPSPRAVGRMARRARDQLARAAGLFAHEPTSSTSLSAQPALSCRSVGAVRVAAAAFGLVCAGAAHPLNRPHPAPIRQPLCL